MGVSPQHPKCCAYTNSATAARRVTIVAGARRAGYRAGGMSQSPLSPAWPSGPAAGRRFRHQVAVSAWQFGQRPRRFSFRLSSQSPLMWSMWRVRGRPRHLPDSRSPRRRTARRTPQGPGAAGRAGAGRGALPRQHPQHLGGGTTGRRLGRTARLTCEMRDIQAEFGNAPTDSPVVCVVHREAELPHHRRVAAVAGPPPPGAPLRG